jgi:hypothetical protein
MNIAMPFDATDLTRLSGRVPAGSATSTPTMQARLGL